MLIISQSNNVMILKSVLGKNSIFLHTADNGITSLSDYFITHYSIQNELNRIIEYTHTGIIHYNFDIMRWCQKTMG